MYLVCMYMNEIKRTYFYTEVLKSFIRNSKPPRILEGPIDLKIPKATVQCSVFFV